MKRGATSWRGRVAPLLAAVCVLSGSAVGGRVARAQAKAQAPASTASSSRSASLSPAQVDELMRVLGDAAITHLEAKVSVEKVEVRGARVLLRGVLVRDVKLGLKLRARGTKALLESLRARSPRSGEVAAVLAAVQLGIYNSLEIGLRLKALGVRELKLDAQDLRTAGLHAWAQARMGSREETIRLGQAQGAAALSSLVRLLSRASVSRASTGLSLADLEARSLRAQLQGVALDALWVGFNLGRSE